MVNGCIYTVAPINQPRKILDNISTTLFYFYLLVVDVGVGVHLVFAKSRSFPLELSQPPALSIASARRVAATPIVVLCKSLCAAGVRLPEASDRLGVQDGGAIEPLDFVPGVLPPNISAFARKLFAALEDNLCESSSRDVTAGIWNGVRISPDSSLCPRIRGVACRVPQVISCLIALGPSSAGVGDGRLGTRVNPSSFGLG